MAVQQVGLQAVFNTTQFTRGLKIYQRGLSQVALSTAQASTNLNSMNRNLIITNSVIKLTGRSARQAGGSFKSMSVGATALAVAAGTLATRILGDLVRAFTALAKQGLATVIFFERLELAINFFQARSATAKDSALSFAEALKQTQRQAQGLLIFVRNLAIASPFTTKQVGTVFRVAQAYGLLAEEAQALLPLLLDLGAATGLDPQTLENAARALGQIRARGKLTGEEVRQLGNAGIPIRDILVKELGIANEEFDKLLEGGAFVANITIPAILKSLEDFRGAGEEVAFNTIGGLLSAFDELREIGIGKLFEGIFEPLKEGLNSLVEFLNRSEFLAFLQIIGTDIGGLVAKAVQSIAQAFRSVLDAWRSLDPAMQQAIVVFAVAFVSISALVGVTGLLITVMVKLINPFTLLVGAISAGLALWSTNALNARDTMFGLTKVMGALNKETSSTSSGFSRGLQDMSRANKEFVVTMNQVDKATTGAFEPIKDSVGGVLESYSDWRNENESNLFSSFETLRDNAIGVFNDIGGGVASVVSAFRQMSASVLDTVTGALEPLGKKWVDLSNTIGRSLSSLSEQLDSVLATWSQAFVQTLASAAGAIGSFGEGLSNMASGAIASFNDMLDAAVDFGAGMVESCSAGVEGATTALDTAMKGIGSVLSFWLAPGSPSRAYPDSTKHGEGNADEFYLGFAKADPLPSIKVMRNNINRAITSSPLLRDALAEGENDVDVYLAGVGDRLTSRKIKGPEIDEEIVEGAAAVALEASQAFVQGFADGFPQPSSNPVNEKIEELLKQIAGGRQLSLAGSDAIGNFLAGFKEADFGALNSISGEISGLFKSFADLGKIEAVDVPRLLFGTNEAFAQAIDDFRATGAVAADTFDRVRKAAGPAATQVELYLNDYVKLAAATDDVTEAQERLTVITENYNNKLTPLRRELERIEGIASGAQEEREIAALRRVASNQLVTQSRRTEASAKIRAIELRNRIKGLETAEEKETSAAEKELKDVKKIQEFRQITLNILKDRLGLQNKQVALVAQEATIIDRLNKQLEKENEKQLTLIERQLKFQRLLGAEQADTLKAAKAKYDLDRLDSTELEKNQATLALHEVALNRINRAAEATELGFDPALLIPLRDTAITLDDLGIKTKNSFEGVADADSVIKDNLQDLNKLAEEWEQTLGEVWFQWFKIKTEIGEIIQEINDNLPKPIRFLPEFEGGTPPIIENLWNFRWALGSIAALLAAGALLSGIGKVAAGIAAIKGALGVGGVAAAATGAGAGAGAAGGGVVGGLGALAAALGTIALPAAAAAGGLLILAAAYNVVKKEGIGAQLEDQTPFDVARREGVASPRVAQTMGTQPAEVQAVQAAMRAQLTMDEQELGNIAATNAQGSLSSLVDEFRIQTPPQAAVIRDTIGSEITSTPLFTREDMVNLGKPLGQDLGVGIAQGIESLPSVTIFKALESFLFDPVSSTSPSTPALPTDKDFLGEIGQQEGFGTVGIPVGQEIGEGIGVGLTTAPGLPEATQLLVTQILDGIAEDAEIKSPSELFAREIGEPIAQGIIQGILTADVTEQMNIAVTRVVEQMGGLTDAVVGASSAIRRQLPIVWAGIRIGLVREVTALVRSIGASFTSFVTSSQTVLTEFFTITDDGFTLMSESAITAMDDMETGVGDAFDNLQGIVIPKIIAFSGAVVGQFFQMGTDINTELTTISGEIVDVFTAEQGGMITNLNNALFGQGATTDSTNPVYQIGADFIEGIAQGIRDTTYLLESAVADAMIFAVEAGATVLKNASPSKVTADEIGLPFAEGIAVGISRGTGAVQRAVAGVLEATVGANFASSPSTGFSTVSNVSRTNNYNLNVSGSQNSQGVISDFAIMQVMGA